MYIIYNANGYWLVSGNNQTKEIKYKDFLGKSIVNDKLDILTHSKAGTRGGGNRKLAYTV